MSDYYAACNIEDVDDIKGWLRARGQEARDEGNHHGLRATHIEERDMMVLEGWEKPMREYPKVHVDLVLSDG